MKERSIVNPFVVSGYEAPKYFCDRELETKKIVEALENGRNVSLISPRRMGKTGLIHHVFHTVSSQNQDIRCFYIDIFSTHSLQEFVITLGKVVLGSLDTRSDKVRKQIIGFFRNIRPLFSFDPLTGVPTVSLELQEAKTEDGLKEIFNYLEASGKKCYIGIDEFQQITEYPEKGVEALLRSHIQFLSNVRFVFAGSKKHLMDAMFSSVNRPFYQSTQKIGLKEISIETYERFAQVLFLEGGKTLSSEVFSSVYNQLKGHTWYVQYVLNLLYSKPQKEYSIKDVDDILTDTLEEEDATYKTYCEVIAKGQLRLLQAIAKEQKVSKPMEMDFMSKYRLTAQSSVKQALNVRLEKSLILKDEEGAYYVYDRFFSLWLARN